MRGWRLGILAASAVFLQGCVDITAFEPNRDTNAFDRALRGADKSPTAIAERARQELLTQFPLGSHVADLTWYMIDIGGACAVPEPDPPRCLYRNDEVGLLGRLAMADGKRSTPAFWIMTIEAKAGTIADIRLRMIRGDGEPAGAT